MSHFQSLNTPDPTSMTSRNTPSRHWTTSVTIGRATRLNSRRTPIVA